MYKYLLLFLLPLQGYCALDTIWEIDPDTLTARIEVGGPQGLTTLTFNQGTTLSNSDAGRITKISATAVSVDTAAHYEEYTGRAYLRYHQTNDSLQASCDVPFGPGAYSTCVYADQIPTKGPKVFKFGANKDQSHISILRAAEGINLSGTSVTVTGSTTSNYNGKVYQGKYILSGRLKFRETRGPSINLYPAVVNITCSPSEPCETSVSVDGDWFWDSAELAFNLPPGVKIYDGVNWISGSYRTSIYRKIRKTYRFRVSNPTIGTSTYSVPVNLTVS